MRYSFLPYGRLPVAAAFTLLTLTNCVNTPKTKTSTTTQAPAPTPAVAVAPNPLLEKWGGPYGGVPPFDKVKIADIKPALESAMAENLAEIDKITANIAPANFENTIVTLERTGRTLTRVMTIYDIWSSNMNNAEFQEVEKEMAPKL